MLLALAVYTDFLPRNIWALERKWWVCALLLCASTINYMDRVTLAAVSRRVIEEFSLSKEQYGTIEQYFGYAFAFGAIFFGILVDRVSARWLYPVVLVCWSAAGICTGLAGVAGPAFSTLLICRTALGWFESGHWPCALQTTQRLLEPKDRALGNSLLQSGVSIGAIVTPVIIGAMLTGAPGSWRMPFVVIGAIGMLWVVAWVFTMRGETLPAPGPAAATALPWRSGLAALLRDHRFWILAFTVSAINVTWHIFRVWLPLVFQDKRGLSFTEAETLNRILPGYYIMTDLGCLAAGAATVWLHRRGWSVLNSRRSVFTVCALLMMLAMFVPALSRGELAIPGLSARAAAIGVMMLVAAGSLGVFPCYYAFSQELSSQQIGLVTGLLSFVAWISSSSLHKPLGAHVDRTGSYDVAFLLGAWPAILAAGLLWAFWGKDREAA